MLTRIFFVCFVVGFASCITSENKMSRKDLVKRTCSSMASDSPICKRFSDPELTDATETVFSPFHSIYHFRSERDDSESFIPEKASPMSQKQALTRQKRQFFYPPPMGFGFLPPLMTINSNKGGFGGPFGGAHSSNFQMTLGRK